MFLVERRTSLFWIVHGETRMSTSLQSLLGLGLENRRSLTIGSAGWPLTITVLRNSSLAGLFTDRAPAEARRPQRNLLMQLFAGLAIRIHDLGRPGKRAKDWRNSSHIVEPYLSWMAWSRCRILLARKKDGYAILPFRRFCANLRPSIRGFA